MSCPLLKCDAAVVRSKDALFWEDCRGDHAKISLAFPGWDLVCMYSIGDYQGQDYLLFHHRSSGSLALSSVAFGTCELCCPWESALCTGDFESLFVSMEHTASDSTFASGEGMLAYLRRDYPEVLAMLPPDIVRRYMIENSRMACPPELITRDKDGRQCLRLPTVYAHVHRVLLSKGQTCALGPKVKACVQPFSSQKVNVWSPDERKWISANHYAPEQYEDLVRVMRTITLASLGN